MELSSDDAAYRSAFDNSSLSSPPPSSLLFAIQTALAFRISQLPKCTPLPPKSPIAAGLPPLHLLSKAPSRSARLKSLSQPLAQARTSPAIAEGKQQDFSPGPRLERPKETPSSRIAAHPAGGECSGTEDFSPVDISVLAALERVDARSYTALRRRPKSAAVPVDSTSHRISAVPLVDNLVDRAEERLKYPQKRSTEIRPEGNVLEEAVGSQAREFPDEDEISSERSAQQRACGNSVPTLTPGSQHIKTNSWSTGYDSDVEDDVGNAELEATFKKRGSTEVVEEESETQTELLQGRRTLHPEMDYVEGSSVRRMPGEQTEQSSSDLLLIQWAVAAVQFQVRLIVETGLLLQSFFQWCNSFASGRIEETLQAKDRATEAVSQRVVMISTVPPKISESGTLLLKRAAWGCLAATYVCLLLIILLLPALLLDFAFVSKIVEEPASIRESVHFDYTQPNPTAVVFLRPLQGDGGSRGKVARYRENFRAIPVSHRVHITCMLTLPESDYNRNLGMFQLMAELLSENGKVVKSSSRPCILQYRSAPIRLAKTVLASLPSLMGIFVESQTLAVRLMEFEEQHVSISAVRILLQPKAGMTLGAGIPEIYSATVHIESVLPWQKEILRNWKWTFYIWMALVLYFLEILMVLCCCRQVLMPRTWVGKTNYVNNDRTVGRANVTIGDTREGAYREG